MRLSVQLYTVRDALAEDYVGTLKKLKDIGLEYVEGAGNYGGGSAEEGKKILDDLGLKASGSHVGIDQLQHDLDEVIETHQTMEIPFVIIPYLAEGDRNDYTKLAGILEPIGHKLKDKGLTLCYHNHDFEFQKLNDETGLDILYSKTDPTLSRPSSTSPGSRSAATDPATYIQKYADRTPLVHLKDFDSSEDPPLAARRARAWSTGTPASPPARTRACSSARSSSTSRRATPSTRCGRATSSSTRRD